MIIVELKYVMSNKMDSRNWVLVAEHDGMCKYTETLKFTTKPKGKMLRKYVKLLRDKVNFSKYWDEV